MEKTAITSSTRRETEGANSIFDLGLARRWNNISKFTRNPGVAGKYLWSDFFGSAGKRGFIPERERSVNLLYAVLLGK